MGHAEMDTSVSPADARGGAASETLQLFSHDIRSAMSDVIGGLRLIDRDRLTPEAQLQIDRVQAAADTLAALVDGALMAAAGETLIHRDTEAVPVADWLAALNGRWSGRASEMGGRFRLDAGPRPPGTLRVPQIALDRIVGNLISNAINHAPGTPVVLTLAGARGQGVTLAVTDGGAGFPQAVLDRVGRGHDPAPMGSTAGTGLGLRIAAELSHQIGGTLGLRNGPGGGAAHLHLPDARVGWDAPGQPPAPAAAPPPDLGGLRLLVAEDNLTNQTILRTLLGGMGAKTVFVADGAAALEMLETRPFDLALIDIEMPRLSGIEVMQAVRARADAVARLPMVALTAYVLRDNREAIYAAGADGIIGKPISSGPDFGRAILRYAGRPAGLAEPEDVLARGAGDASLGCKMDEARFAALLEVAGAEGAAELLQRLHEDLSAVRDALDAAVADGDTSEIRAQTHILIAISGAVGAERLHRLAEVLNIATKRRRTADLAALYAPSRADLQDLIARVATHAAEIGQPPPG